MPLDFLMPIAQVAAGGGSIVHFVIVAIIVAAVVGIGLVVFRQSGIPVPSWAAQIVWICVVAVVAIFAIKFLLSMT
jgi:hypothetical protein